MFSWLRVEKFVVVEHFTKKCREQSADGQNYQQKTKNEGNRVGNGHQSETALEQENCQDK